MSDKGDSPPPSEYLLDSTGYICYRKHKERRCILCKRRYDQRYGGERKDRKEDGSEYVADGTFLMELRDFCESAFTIGTEK